MELNQTFCEEEYITYNQQPSNECIYNQQEEAQVRQKVKENKMQAIRGRLKLVRNVEYNEQENCTNSFELVMEQEDGQEAIFIISGGTYFVDCIPNQVGTKLVGFYDSSLPMPLIYPPQYQIKVLAMDFNDRFVDVDFFDCFLLNSSKEIQLKISNNTYVLSEKEGKPYCGNISNKYMVVLYNRMTRSMPAMVVPNVVIVLE